MGLGATTRAEVATEAHAAAADRVQIASPTPRRQQDQLHQHQTTRRRRFRPEPAVGIVYLVTKAENVSQIVLSLSPFQQLRNRETPTGAGDCELGDPLLFINGQQKRPLICSRRNH